MSEACLHMTQLMLVTSKENVPKAKGKGREEPVMANIPLSSVYTLRFVQVSNANYCFLSSTHF